MTTSEAGLYEGPLHQLARSAWQSVLVTGILSIVLGILVLIWPGPTLVVAGILFGIYLIVSGILQMVAAFGTHASAGLRVLAFVSGAVSFALAFFCFRSIGNSVLLLAIWIGVSWLFRGITLLAAAISDSDMPSRGWQIFYGIVLAIGGGVLISWPIESIATLTIVTGWWLIFLGVFEVFGSFQIRSQAKATPSAL
ncbi:HdeD family acid-resistance protein [Nocardia sp. NPDC048505]|uniref:HdeD family acid-resistance protein n=1 Tax=unclassified Nocardia TaxID=2637762 RepID=UPI0033F2D108